MAILGASDYLCEACKNFDTDGIDGNHPSCDKQSPFRSHAFGLGGKCPYGFEFGVPSGYPVHMDRNRRRAYEIAAKLGIEVD